MMLKFLLLFCLLLIFYAACQVGLKTYKIRHYRKSKASNTATALAAVPLSNYVRQEMVHVVEAHEQELFDDVASLLFQQKTDLQDPAQAEQLQQRLFYKMPGRTTTHIRRLDLGEWSIYWNFYGQSLEYYVGCYGIFYTHVDRFGQEHKLEIAKNLSHSHCI